MRATPALRSFALSALFLSIMACGHTAMAPAVSVREAQVRSDDLRLPLSTDDQEHLIMFLAAGGNRDLLETGDSVDLAVPRRYQPLLGLLSSEENLDPEDLDSSTFRKWFPKEPVRQVIDARAARPPVADAPFAVTDGKYWWVFSRGDSDKFSRLVVFQAFNNPDQVEGMSR
ncbi:MAG TPA: hypothetical protein VK539_39495 [Myxococcaceae bacterium]|nr:hypothetical protein [Myxococcaceae bacterium]